ncbi:MAG: hypothetical protein ACI4F7_06085 [Acutalibacteraceae bacterium]
MKKLNTGLKIVISTVAVIAIIGSAFFIRDSIQKHRIATRKPFLRIEAKVPNFWIFKGDTDYYIVYDNGDLEKTEEFSTLQAKTYDLYLYDEEHMDKSEIPDTIPPYVDKIIAYIKDKGSIYLTESYFICGDRYFFTVDGDHECFLYEYFPQKDKAKQITKVQNHDIVYVELY